MPKDYEAASQQDLQRATPEEAAPPPRKRPLRRAALLLAAAAILVGASWFGYDWWTVGRFMVSTDDAYVAADFAVMAPKTTGYVERVPAIENGRVSGGDPLVVLDERDYRIALDAAEARVNAQQASLVRIDRQIDVARAALGQAKAKLVAARAEQTQAGQDFERYAQLTQSDFASRQKLDAARAAKASADAAVSESEAGVTSANAQIAVAEAERKEAEATLAELKAARESAARDLHNATIRAPFDGTVGNLSVAAGDYVAPGRRLMAVVPLSKVYIEANFKETQIEGLASGTPVTVDIDAFPDRSFQGRIESVAPASGAVFSLLPPENATGNFTKVVQRVPVRVSVPKTIADEGWLRPGLSVVVTADTRPPAGGDAAAPARR